jgi:hypothetical protein
MFSRGLLTYCSTNQLTEELIMSIRYVLQSISSDGTPKIIHCGEFTSLRTAVPTLIEHFKELAQVDAHAVSLFRRVIHGGKQGVFSGGNHVMHFQTVDRAPRATMVDRKTGDRTYYNFPPRTDIG